MMGLSSQNLLSKYMKKIISSLIFAGLVVLSYGLTTQVYAAPTKITTYKDPNCGCCENWIQHMQKAGYKVKAVDSSDMQSIKTKYKVPEALQSCHTSIVDSTGQVLEGHVPAAAVTKLIANKKIKGIAVPGMPANSPGMGEMNGKLVTVDFNNQLFSKN